MLAVRVFQVSNLSTVKESLHSEEQQPNEDKTPTRNQHCRRSLFKETDEQTALCQVKEVNKSVYIVQLLFAL